MKTKFFEFKGDRWVCGIEYLSQYWEIIVTEGWIDINCHSEDHGGVLTIDPEILQEALDIYNAYRPHTRIT